MYPSKTAFTAILCAIISLSSARVRSETFYVAPDGIDTAAGSQAAPWLTIQHAADALKPGDTVVVSAGIYREQITLKQGGWDAAPITFSAAPGARVVVTGADRLDGGWTKAPEPNSAVYSHEWPHRFPIAGPNDLTHPGDKEHELTGRAEQVIHGGRLLRQVLARPQVAPGSFYCDLDAKKLYVWLRGSDDPNHTEMEASVRTNWVTSAPDVSFVHFRGFIFRYAANHAQRGAFNIAQAPRNSITPPRGWVVEDCTFERANGPGASLSGEAHLFRRCIFQDNGQLGFGTSRCNDTRMEQCELYRNNVKGYSTGWEAGACKVTMSRGFVFDRCRSVDNRGTGIWFDIGNEKSEVSHCYIADNDEAGIFYEISYGLHAHDNLIVNNANNGESVGGAWGEGGITLSSSEDCVVENNTLIGNRDGIAFREQSRTTPRIEAPDGAAEVRILNKNHRIRNNIVAYSQAFNIAMWMDTNFFGPHPSGGDKNSPIFEDPKTLKIVFTDNLLWPLPGRSNYLYGAPWRSKSRTFKLPAEFSSASGLSDTSRVADPLFVDVAGRNYSLKDGSPAVSARAGVRDAKGNVTPN